MVALKAKAAQSSAGEVRRPSTPYPPNFIIEGRCCPEAHPPLGSFFDLRSLKLTRDLAVAFFFVEAMLFLGSDVLG